MPGLSWPKLSIPGWLNHLARLLLLLKTAGNAMAVNGTRNTKNKKYRHKKREGRSMSKACQRDKDKLLKAIGDM